MASFCFFVQLADRTLILKQKEFFVFIIASRLLLNHSPSEWFSSYKKPAQQKAPPQRGINQIPFMSRARGHRIISGGLALHYIG